MGDKYYITKGSKVAMKWALMLLLIVVLFGLSGKIFTNKLNRLLPAINNFSVQSIPFATYDIVLPESTTSINLSSPSSIKGEVNKAIDEVEDILSSGIW